MPEYSYVLNCYRVAFRQAKIEPLGAAGGMSGARFWRITGSQDLYVLRRWPSEHPATYQLQFIHDVLSHAVQKGVTYLPLPIATNDGQTFVSHDRHLWELAPWLPGAANYHESPSANKLRSALIALAKFHEATKDFELHPGRSDESIAQVPVESGPAPGIIRRLERLHELQAAGAAPLKRAIAAADWPELAHAAHQFVELLPKAVPLATSLLTPLAEVPFVVQPCLRDVWHDHVLFVDNDVARLLGSLAVDDAGEWQRGLEAYATIRPFSADELRAVAALDASSTVLAGCNWIRWVFVENRQFDDREQVGRRLALLLDRLQRLVQKNASSIQ
jgi:hypothetical protein